MDGYEAFRAANNWPGRIMITLLTGGPGTGKTAALVSMLEELGAGRQLYVNGIPDLLIPHEKLEEPERWPELVPDGAVIVIDEVQRIWRPRGPGQKVPDHVAMLETHRHRGLDVYIITQGPNLVDSNVRALVGRHVHLRDLGVLGRWWYEWPECADNCRTAWKNAPIKKRYRLPKHIFSKYKSSSLHVKPVRSVPWMLVVMFGALVSVGALSWLAYQKISERMNPKPAAVVAPSSGASAAPAAVNPAMQASPAVDVAAAPDERVAFIPRLSDRPWTAPAYDHLRQVVRMPVIAGGVCMGGRCVCVSSDGAELDVSSEACSGWIKRRPFDPYTLPPQASAAGAASGTASENMRSERGQTGSAPAESAALLPMPSGVSNPRADSLRSSPLPPGSPVHPVGATDGRLSIAPPTLLSPYRLV